MAFRPFTQPSRCNSVNMPAIKGVKACSPALLLRNPIFPSWVNNGSWIEALSAFAQMDLVNPEVLTKNA